jgi:phospholipase/carboxylesterase
MTSEMSFLHRFVPASATDRRPLLLLHGTGGTEDDLVPLGRTVAPGAALISPRGKVLENGMPRFFRRLAEGVLDEEDVGRRAAELAAFVSDATSQYDLERPVALGFSNGANMAAAVLLLHPGALAGAVLLRPMAPLAQPPEADLSGTRVLILSGSMDPMVPSGSVARLVADLTRGGAEVEERVLPAGHAVSQADLSLAATWLDRNGRVPASAPANEKA